MIAGGGSSAGGATGGGGAEASGVPLTPTMGWVDGMSNTLGIQGAVFSYSDMTSATGLTTDVTGPKACIKGTAAKVVMPCTIVPPATDCYGTYWGAALGENLNQPIDPATGMGVMTPMPFDASTLKGFAFDVDGPMVPVAAAFRFNVEDASNQYCTPTAKGIKSGSNSYQFTDLVTKCYATPPGPSADTAKSALIKISWQVVTSPTSTVPFDFCISNVRALQ
jgi:hypothetical protein